MCLLIQAINSEFCIEINALSSKRSLKHIEIKIYNELTMLGSIP